MTKFYDPAFKVQVNGSALAADISGQIKSVTVTHEINTADSFDFTLVNQYPKMRWTHTSDRDLFRIGGAVVIEMGYVSSALQKLVDGVITSLAPSFPESGGPTLVVKGQNRAYKLQGSEQPFQFVNKTDQEILSQLVEKTGLTVQAEDTGAGPITRTEDKSTAWQFILKRAAEVNFEALVEGKTLIFRKAKLQTQAYSLEYGQTLRSFKASLDLKKQVKQVEVRGNHDFGSDKDIVGKAGPGDELGGGSGQKTAAQLAADWLGSQDVDVQAKPVKTQKEADDLAKAIYNQNLAKACIGDAASVGIPDLRAGKVVELKGLGPLFSGQYKITKSTHTLSESGYQTAFSVERSKF
jgi:phage protein D